MRNILLVLNIILLMAVGVLFYLHFSSKSSTTALHTSGGNHHNNSTCRIAYFDLDSLENQYEYFKETRNYLRGKEEQITKTLNAMRNDYIKQVKAFQQQGAGMSQAQQGEIEQKLLRMQNAYQEKEQDLAQDMQSESLRKLQEVKMKIQGFLKDYCKEKGFSYIMASNDNDYLYFKDTAYNVTTEVVALLNNQHKSSKKK